MSRHLTWIALASVLVLGAGPVGADEPADTREPVQRTEAEKAFALGQMRLFLATIAAIEEDLGAGDMDKVASDASARGKKGAAGLARPPSLAAKESDAWKAMIASTRGSFDTIADLAAAREPAAKINKALAGTMQNCIACHQTYRISADGR